LNRLSRAVLRWLPRTHVHWAAFWLSPDTEWLPAGPPSISQQQLEAAFSKACTQLNAVPLGVRRRGYRGKSVGSRVRLQDASESWLKVSGAQFAWQEWPRHGELSAPSIEGVSRPSITAKIEWRDEDVSWQALQFTIAPSPTISETPWLPPTVQIEESWLAEIKRTVDRLAALPVSRWNLHPGRVAKVIAERYGRRAPHVVDEWRTAHGDLHWANLTAPDLVLLDWEFWGTAPRGFDAATLLSFSFSNSELFQRIEATFAEDLDTSSGIVARLFAFAQRLQRIEAGDHDPREYRSIEREAKRLLRLEQAPTQAR
jgi:hypothetical protein